MPCTATDRSGVAGVRVEPVQERPECAQYGGECAVMQRLRWCMGSCGHCVCARVHGWGGRRSRIGAFVRVWVVSGLPSWLLLLVFLGSALGGLIVLAIATNLPEIAITVSAALSHQLDIAVGNILGGIAVQTVVLVALDAFGMKVRKPLTYQAASLVLVLEGALVVVVLLVVVAGAQLPASLLRARLTPDVVVIAVVWIAGLVLVDRASKCLPWSDSGDAPDTQPQARGTRRTRKEAAATKQGMSTGHAAALLIVSAVATLVTGVSIE